VLEFGASAAVKICGITNVDDAMTCAAAGAEMLGLNFSPHSLRCLSPAQAAEITTAVRAEFPGVKFVGVFVNQESEFVQTVAKDLAFDAVQLHGDEDQDYVRNLGTLFVIKALRVNPQFTPIRVTEYDCDAILLDTWSPDLAGGTGQSFPWSMAAAARPLVRRFFLAGGLTSENIANALKVVRPFAVDVCSGVEDAPGRKNHVKVRRFIEAVHTVDEVNA
jgi:phosphoribosylanthranilate isomerase